MGGKWRVLIRRKGHAAQCKTFPTKAQAERWARQREADIAGGAAPQLAGLTVADVIDAYERLRDASRPISDSSNEHYMLKALRRGLGHLPIATMTPQHLVDFAGMRREEGAGPYTINMDVSKLGTVMRYGGASLRLALPDVVGAARPLLTHLRLIGGGGRRDRRPTDDELARVIEAMTEKRGKLYGEAVAFAAVSAMRRGEVCAFKWADIDMETRVVALWRKDPRKGKVLERVPILPPAWEIVKRQPASEDGRVFPLHPGTLSKYFTEACRALSIPDLHFHDCRHEGTSRMFEGGYTIPEVALVTGHKSWNMLKRYTQLKPEDLTRPASGKRPDARQRPGSQQTASRRQGKSGSET